MNEEDVKKILLYTNECRKLTVFLQDLTNGDPNKTLDILASYVAALIFNEVKDEEDVYKFCNLILQILDSYNFIKSEAGNLNNGNDKK